MRAVVAGLVLVLTVAGAATAQTPKSATRGPASLTDAGVAAWVAANRLEGERYRYVSWSPEGAFFLLKDGVNGLGEPVLRYLAKRELFATQAVLGAPTRSMSLLIDSDCNEGKSRLFDVYAFPRSGLQGPSHQAGDPNPFWEAKGPGLPTQAELPAICKTARALYAEQVKDQGG
jgi:hypothetical protein